MYSTAYKLLHSASASQDALQEIFIKVWVNREELATMEHFSAWLGTITRNHLYNLLRNQLRGVEQVSLLMDEDSVHAVDQVYNESELQELLLLVNQGLETLSPQQRKVIQLSRFEGLKHREIAEVMQLSPETVKKYIMDALRSLRAYVQLHGKDISILILLELILH